MSLPVRSVAAAFAVAVLAAPVAAQQTAALRPDSAPVAAQVPLRSAPTTWSRVTVAGEWAHIGAGTVSRPDNPFTAVRSMVGVLSLPVGDVAAPRFRVDLGWVRAVRSANTSQGATLGISRPITVPGVEGRLRVIPGAAVAAGWAEQETVAGEYAWQGRPGTSYAGQSGTQLLRGAERSRMTGVGGHVAAELSLDGLLGRESRGVSLAGSVRHWAFQGRAAAPNRQVTLVGLGLALRPSDLVTSGVGR